MLQQITKKINASSIIQYFIFIAVASLLLIAFATVAPKRTEAAPFTCNNSFYQIIYGSLTQLDPNTGQYITLGSTGSLNTNAVGYNQEDDYLYGIQTIAFGGSNGLVRLEHNGASTPLGIPDGLPWPASYASGDFDNAGNLLVSDGSSTLYSIDVSTNIATAIALTATVAANDLVYVNGLLYGLNSTTLIEVNPGTGVVTNRAITIPPDSGSPGSVYGAGWAADNSKLFFARNSDGMIFEISNFSTSNPSAAVVLDGDSAAGNDGASCSVARSPIPPFFATNDTGTVAAGSSLTVSAGQGLLVNDSGREISVTSYTQPINGTVTINPDGSYTYTPNNGFTGTDTFTYTITDEYGETETATVTVTVTTAPVAPNLANTGISQHLVLVLSLSAVVLSGIFLNYRITR